MVPRTSARPGERVAGEWFRELAITKSPNTIRYYGRIVREWLSYLCGTGTAYDRAERRDVVSFVAGIRERCSNSSASTYLHALRSWYQWLLDQRYVLEDPTRRLRLRPERRLPDPLSPEAVQFLVEASIGARERALIICLHSTGCRISELLGLNVDTIQWSSAQAVVLGKRVRERVVYFTDEALEALREMIGTRRTGPLFLLERWPRRMTVSSAENMLSRIAARAGIGHVHPHQLRHSFGTDLLNNGANLRAVQELMGHQSIATTEIYTHVSQVYLRKTHQNAHPRARRGGGSPAESEVTDG